MAVVDAMRTYNPTLEDEERRTAEMKSLMHECRRAELIAPTAVRYRLIELMADGITDRTGTQYRETRSKVLQEMRRNLRINQRTPWEKIRHALHLARYPRTAWRLRKEMKTTGDIAQG